MAGSRVLRAACLLFLVILSSGPAAAGTGAFLDYLYIEPNEGDSSGGHAALRLDRYTFHFVHEDPGIVRLRRYDSGAFDYAYAKLGNRPIHQSRIAVSTETYRSVDDTFSRFLLIQDAQMEERDALRRDVRVLEALLARARGVDGPPAAISLPAAGYFLTEIRDSPEGVKVPTGAAPALVALREKVSARYGSDFLPKRLEELQEELAEADPKGGGQPPPTLTPEAYPPLHTSGAGHFYDVASEAVALSVLEAALPLRPGTYWQGEGDHFTLSPQEVKSLASYAERLEGDLVRLIKSRRPDRALPLLVGMARLSAVRESLAAGRLVVLDFFEADAATPSAGEPPYLGELERELRQVFQERRREFFTEEGGGEARYASLERAGNLLLEVQRARRAQTSLRKPPVPSLPARGASFIPAAPAGGDAPRLALLLGGAREAERSYAEALRSVYAYDLLNRNCVTELFAVLNSSMARLCEMSRDGSCSEAQVREESVRRLGGYVDGSRGLVFIPFVSADQVSARYRVTAQSETPSYRQEKMALMAQREAPLKVFLRESNTFTSTIYRPGPDDSFFIFFTDNAGVLRPLFGVINLLAGVGETLYGAATAPVMGTRHLVSGVKGICFSLPELFFVSLRKGSMGYVERDTKAP